MADTAIMTLVEAEAFSYFGGWVLDTQFTHEMGSPYLMAHGLGVPVQDAITSVKLPNLGAFRIWVRTKDWTAPWQANGSPGRFRLLINDAPLDPVFGTEGTEWHWQDGGCITIDTPEVTLRLHDLTGFNARCDAILLTPDTTFIPPDQGKPLADLRESLAGDAREPVPAGHFDLAIVGGGIAGICAALAASQLGQKVALIQDRPVLGGNNSSEVRVRLAGKINQPPYPAVGSIVAKLEQPEPEPGADMTFDELAWQDQKRTQIIQQETNISLFLNHKLAKVDCSQDIINAVIAEDVRTGSQIRIESHLFADCSGDGDLGFLAGADFEMTRTGHMGPTNVWRVTDTGKASEFPHCPWALDLKDAAFPGRGKHVAQWAREGLHCLGQWFWECGFSWDPITETERMRDWNLRAMFGAWDTLKNDDGLYPDHRIDWAAYIAGKRESRRLLGDVILTQQHVVEGHQFPDGCFPCTWALDLHRPHDEYKNGFDGREFIAYSYNPAEYERPYWAPYRCLYSRNINNLFMAGRDISVTHEALGTVRVMRTTGMMGEIIGMAASLCREHDCLPRGVYEDHLQKLLELMKQPPWR